MASLPVVSENMAWRTASSRAGVATQTAWASMKMANAIRLSGCAAGPQPHHLAEFGHRLAPLRLLIMMPPGHGG